MLQDFMWTTFERTGNIDAYLSYKEIEETNKKDGQRIADHSQVIQLDRA